MIVSPSSNGSWRDYEALLRWRGQGKGSPRGRQPNACDHDGKFYKFLSSQEQKTLMRPKTRSYTQNKPNF